MGKEIMSRIIEEFGKGFGIPDARLGDYGSWSFLAGDILVTLQADGDGTVECFSFLGEIEHPTEDLYETLLEADFFFRETHGATIGVSKATRVATLAYRMPVEGLDGGKFRQVMENFINLAAHWQARLAGAQGFKTADPVFPVGMKA